MSFFKKLIKLGKSDEGEDLEVAVEVGDLEVGFAPPGGYWKVPEPGKAWQARVREREGAKQKASGPAECPYCKQVLEPPPKRTRKCPDCKERIVRRNDWDGEKSHISYLTEEQNKQVAAEELEVEMAAFRNYAAETKSKAEKTGKWEDLHEASAAQHRLAVELSMNGMPWLEQKTLSDQWTARYHFLQAVQMLKHSEAEARAKRLERLASDCCSACKAVTPKVVTVGEAMEMPIVPHGVCTHTWADGTEFCACMWLPQ